MIKEILLQHWHSFIGAIPSIVIGVVILGVAFCLARLGSWATRKILHRKKHTSLLHDLIAKSVGVIIFLLGVYLIFEMANLTGAALAVVSGTGLIGIILGIAFRDITENFLSSILLSIQHPFYPGDLVEIAGLTGYVQGLTMRMTLLMSLDGNHIQIPNAVVYKSIIRNYTSNPQRREDFIVAISYKSAITKAQETALKALSRHEFVLKDPEPLVLVDSLGRAFVNLKVYFWFDGTQHSASKIRSLLMRFVKEAFLSEKIAMPGELIIEESKIPHSNGLDAESDLGSEAPEIRDLAKQARKPEGGTNFLSSED